MSDIEEKINALCSNAGSLKQYLTDLVTMVRTQADTITSLETTNRKLIQQHDEEIEELNFRLTEKDKELSEVTVENKNLHSSNVHQRKCINKYEDQLRAQCKSLMSAESTNSELLKYNEEISQLKLHHAGKDNELTSNQIFTSKLEFREKLMKSKDDLIGYLSSPVYGPYNKYKVLKEREGEIEQLRLKLTETRQKLRDESKKYDELLKSSRKAGVKAANDFSDQSTEESESKFSSDEDSEFQEDVNIVEVIEDINKKNVINGNPSSRTLGQEGRKTLKRKVKNDDGPVSKIAG